MGNINGDAKGGETESIRLRRVANLIHVVSTA